MQIVLFRHGLAIDREDPECPPDFERFLTDKGIERTHAAAAGLRALGVEPDVILASPYVRTRQTAEIAAEELGYAPENVHLTDALVPEAGPQRFLREAAHMGVETVLGVGHAPNMDLIIAHVAGVEGWPFTYLKKAGAAMMEVGPEFRGVLHWLLQPKTLRALARRQG